MVLHLTLLRYEIILFTAHLLNTLLQAIRNVLCQEILSLQAHKNTEICYMILSPFTPS